MPGLRQTRLEPDLKAEISEGEEPPLVEQRVDDHPDVVAAYERYRPSWESWSKEYRRRSLIQSVYAELFRLHTQVQKQGEIVELVLGLGLLTWRSPTKGKSASILRHVVTARVDLHFDPATGIIRLDGAADGAQMKIEDDMLDAELRPERSQYAIVAEQLNLIGDDVWDRPSMFKALKSWAGALHPDTDWSSDLKVAAGADNKPTVSFTPALILRKRTQVGMVRIYDAIIDRLSREAEEVPSGWGGLVDDEDDQDIFDPAPGEGPARPLPRSQEVYFPLPANREQRRIVEAISRRRGVLVQGPPGTGKSHTIANLVCHLLANGNRVLITAETGRALKVLKDKLPEEMRPLCVSLLGQGGDAFAELNSAVQSITTRFAAWSPGAYDERIAEVDRELDVNRRLLARIDAELRSLREEETYPHHLIGTAYVGTASAVALRVSMERDRFIWLRLPREASDDPPVSKSDMEAWLLIRRTYGDDAVRAAQLGVVGTNKLPAPADFATAVAIEGEAKEALERVGGKRLHPAYSSLVALNASERAHLAERLQEIREKRIRLRRVGHGWMHRVLIAALEGRQARWQALLDQSRTLIQRVDQLLDSLGSCSVLMPQAWDIRIVRSDAAAVIEHLNSGGKWTAFGVFTPKAIKDRTYLRHITVDGEPSDTPERLRLVCIHLDLVLAFDALEQAWSDHNGLPSDSQPPIRLAAIKEHVVSLASGLDYARICLGLGRSFGAAIPAIPEPDWLSGQADQWLELIEASALEDQHQRATAQVTACLRELRAARDLHDTHAVIATLIAAVEQRDVTAYSQTYHQVRQIEQTRRDQEFRQLIESKLEVAVPGLIGAVASSLSDTAWDGRFGDWEYAWRWAIADNW
jgi:hypothetical protein